MHLEASPVTAEISVQAAGTNSSYRMCSLTYNKNACILKRDQAKPTPIKKPKR